MHSTRSLAAAPVHATLAAWATVRKFIATIDVGGPGFAPVLSFTGECFTRGVAASVQECAAHSAHGLASPGER